MWYSHCQVQKEIKIEMAARNVLPLKNFSNNSFHPLIRFMFLPGFFLHSFDVSEVVH